MVLNATQREYTVTEAEGSVLLSYTLNREAVRDVSFGVININGTATGAGVGKFDTVNIVEFIIITKTLHITIIILSN